KLSLPTAMLLVSPFSLNLAVLCALIALSISVADLVRSQLSHMARLWQVSMITLRVQRSLAGRTSVALISAASIFPLSALIIRHCDNTWLGFLHALDAGVPALYGLGELAFLLMPIAAAFVVVPW